MEILTREAIKEDVLKILEIVNYEISNSTVIYDYKEKTYDDQLKWFDKKKAEGMPVIVAVREKEVIGFGTYGIFRPWEAYQYSLEHSIYVDEKYKGLGAGTNLLTELINSAKNGGYHTMIAGVDSSNLKSIAFHRKFGFIEIGTFKEIGFKFDKWLNLSFLQLILNHND